MENKPGFLGGKARGKQEREEALKKYYENPNYCAYCNKIIEVQENEKVSTVKKKKFCNQICAAKYNSKIKRKKMVSFLDRITDEDFIRIVKEHNNIEDILEEIGYSKKSKKAKKEIIERIEKLKINITNITGINIDISNRTKGELFEYCVNWQSARSGIQKNAREVFNNSNKQKSCIICNYDKHCQVAHIKAVSSFKDNTLISEINNIDNLIALCPNHHWEYDNDLLEIKIKE